jgi:hypothetical protein
MGITYRQWPMIVVLLVITGTAVLMSFVYSDAENDRQDIDLTQVQALLDSSTRMAEYRLIPESVMTGLCWVNADGAREGLFKDVNAGIAHWREQEPSIPADAGPVVNGMSISAEDGIDYALLSNELDQLSFVATEYRYNMQTAEITGILTIDDNSRRVALTVVLPENALEHRQKDRIELTASSVTRPTDFGDALSAVTDQPLDLCIAMQAAKKQILPDLSSDQPLMLSHYY